MLLLSRIFAQFIDLLIGVFSILLTFLYILPFLSVYIKNNILLAVIGIFTVCGIILLIQYPFLKNHQTLGKGFFSLKIISTDEQRPLCISIILQRELLCKLISCYFICIPVFFRKLGGHEEATRTAVVRARKVR